MIRLMSVSKRFDNAADDAVRGLTLSVDAGELLILLGESGCGKTTTLKMVNRLIEPSEGRIEIDGDDVREVDPIDLRRRIGYVFQGIGLFPHMTVAENIGIVPRLLGWKRRRIRDRTDDLLELVGLKPATYRDRDPAHLSGGQRQRIGVARALAAEARIMLLDEPFGALDPITRDELQNEFADLQKRLNLTAIMVTHDMTEALLMGDRIAVMKSAELISVGTPSELLRRPPHEYIEQLMASPRRQVDRVERLMRDEEESEAP